MLDAGIFSPAISYSRKITRARRKQTMSLTIHWIDTGTICEPQRHEAACPVPFRRSLKVR